MPWPFSGQHRGFGHPCLPPIKSMCVMLWQDGVWRGRLSIPQRAWPGWQHDGPESTGKFSFPCSIHCCTSKTLYLASNCWSSVRCLMSGFAFVTIICSWMWHLNLENATTHSRIILNVEYYLTTSTLVVSVVIICLSIKKISWLCHKTCAIIPSFPTFGMTWMTT